MAWKGNLNNPAPNIAQQSSVLSEQANSSKREEQIRRDTDKQKNYTVTLMDVDGAIQKQLEKFQMSVIDEGEKVTVPVNYASAEKWKSIQSDGYMRDYNGQIILPAIVYSRTVTEKDPSMPNFSPYTNYATLKTYSQKNRYTQFSLLAGQNAPVREVYQVAIPDGMILTYKFIIWTEYVEQMNTLVERLEYESDDYWGDPRGFRFRVWAESFNHTTELQVDQDRLVKTEFDLKVWAYLLPTYQYGLDGPIQTTKKFFTPKKIIIGTETISNSFSFEDTKVRDKWRKQDSPNLPLDEIVTQPPVVFESEDEVRITNPRIPRTVYLWETWSGLWNSGLNNDWENY
jgi:hypothetical protein